MQDVLALPEVTSDRILDLDGYRLAIAPARSAFEARPCYETALTLAYAIVHAVFEYSAPDVRVLLSCSWGKDSSAVVGVLADVMLERKSAGLRVPSVLLMVADTGSEFVDMRERVVEENLALEAWGKRHGFDVATKVVGPKPKNTLLGELIGSGRTLPTYQKSNRATGNNWCVERLKISPMEAALRVAKEGGGRLLHFLGVRMDESERRRASVTRFAAGMPIGLARVAATASGSDEADAIDPVRVGVQPIVHWDHEVLTQYLRRNMAAWSPFSFERLKEIYRKGAAPEDVNGAGECRIAFTADGGVSSVCSDLGGARFGCLLCVMSNNQSLRNFARNDTSYRWIRAVHGFIRAGLKHHRTRMEDSEAHGFSISTLFPKNMTFEWRYKLAMFVYRAEAESGHTLLTPEVENAIEQWWERSGILTVKMADAKADALRWRNTGKLRISWKADEFNYEGLSIGLSEGIPAGIYASLRHEEIAPLALANLMPFAGRGNSFYPQTKAYVFVDTGSRGGFLTYLTDAPSDFGRTVNTTSLAGYEGFALKLLTVRDLTPWEARLMRGRAIFYRHQVGEFERRIAEWIGQPYRPDWRKRREVAAGLGAPADANTKGNAKSRRMASRFPVLHNAADLTEVLLANIDARSGCGEKEFADALYEGHFIAALSGKVSAAQLRELFQLVTAAVDLSDALSAHHEHAHRAITHELGARLAEVGSTSHNRGTAKTRELLRSLLSAGWDMRESLAWFDRYVTIVRKLHGVVAAGAANTELINRITYIARTEIYDQEYASKMIDSLTRTLAVGVRERAAAAA